MKSNNSRLNILLNVRKAGIFLFFLLISVLVSTGAISLIQQNQARAATFPSFYFFANSNKANISSGWGFTLAIETSQAFPTNSTLTILFPDTDDDEWCRSSGALSVVPVSSAPPDAGGSVNIDQAMPGSLSGSCSQGIGPGFSDAISINGIDILNPGVTYGVEVQGNVGVLGTNDIATGNEIEIYLENGALLDDGKFIFETSLDHSVSISATVLPMPECNTNADCSYPLQICGMWQQCVACDDDAQCNFGDVCVSGQCTEDLSCTDNGDCDYGDEVCGPGDQCQQCTSDSQCNTGDRCQSGTCNPIPPAECTVNSQCNYPLGICDVYQQCVPCSTDGQCSGSDTCESGVCTTPPPLECTTNAQCNYPNEICDGAGYCNTCTTDWQCSGDDACVNGVCETNIQCNNNDDCRFPDEVCTLENQCEPCTFDEECGQGNLCTDGVCEAEAPAECTVNDQCNYPVEVCGTGICLSCNTEFLCNTGDVCVRGVCESLPPDECSDNQQCDYPDEVCREVPDDPGEESVMLCESCQDDRECEFGDYCDEGVCRAEDEEGEDLIPVSFTDVFNDLISSIGNTVDNVVRNLTSLTNSGVIITTVSLITSIGIGLSLSNFALLDLPALFTRGILGLLTLLGFRTKGQKYGYVYNSVNKEPVSNAMVRVFTEKQSATDRKRLVETSVTDAFGVFSANLKPGKYTINVNKSGFIFPSKIVTSLSDYPMEKVYHGNPFEVKEKGEIYYSIPIDPYNEGFFSTTRAIIRERFGVYAKFIQLVLTFFGGALSIYLMVVSPNIINAIILALYIPGGFLTYYTLRSGTQQGGQALDEKGEPMADITLGLYDEREQRYLTKRVTDETGFFRFVAPDSRYHLEALDDAYEVLKEDRKYLKSARNEDLIVVASKVTIKRKENKDKFPTGKETEIETGEESKEGDGKKEIGKPGNVINLTGTGDGQSGGKQSGGNQSGDQNNNSQSGGSQQEPGQEAGFAQDNNTGTTPEQKVEMSKPDTSVSGLDVGADNMSDDKDAKDKPDNKDRSDGKDKPPKNPPGSGSRSTNYMDGYEQLNNVEPSA